MPENAVIKNMRERVEVIRNQRKLNLRYCVPGWNTMVEMWYSEKGCELYFLTMSELTHCRLVQILF